jgi:hypothetical protein
MTQPAPAVAPPVALAAEPPVAMPATSGWPATWRKLATVAWLSIALGFTLEVLFLVVAGYHEKMGSTPAPFVADLAQKVSWAFIACMGVAIGSAVSKARPAAMGLLGMIAAPLGFHVARAVHKGVSNAAGLAVAPAALPILLLSVVKAIEYGILGLVIAFLGRRGGRLSLGAHLAAGAGIGIVFGGAVLAVLARSAPGPVDAFFLLSRGINEVLFPVGCSLVLYAGEAVGQRLKG